MTRCLAEQVRPMRRIRRLALIFIALLLLAGCIKAFSKIAYNNLLPQMILSRIDSFFDLNSTQQKYLKSRIAAHHAWHRTTQLKLYLADLKDLKRRFASQLGDKDLDWLTTRLTLHRNAIFSRIIPDLVNILQTLSDEQIDYLQKKLYKENKELDEKLARPLAVRQKEEFATVIKQVEDWAGPLSDSQKEQLRVKYAAIPANAIDWLRYREEQQAIWLTLLRSKPDHQKLKADLEGRMIYQERNVPQRFKASFARTLTLMKEMILTADRLLTPEQRVHVIGKADEYIQLIEELAVTERGKT